jgi:phospholipid/cholesterol/gamma-HCH transport system substrate-binding protein
MPAASDRHTARRRLAGLAFLLVMVLLAGLSVALYQKKFTPVAMVTLYSDSAGSEMHIGAQVMVRGVQVGEVRQVTTTCAPMCISLPALSLYSVTMATGVNFFW